uniref:beta-1,3-galactosyltransferase 1-like n=1 Tax=Myxine glutinosa TaxID=7769 RepID=UPI00358E7AD4
MLQREYFAVIVLFVVTLLLFQALQSGHYKNTIMTQDRQDLRPTYVSVQHELANNILREKSFQRESHGQQSLTDHTINLHNGQTRPIPHATTPQAIRTNINFELDGRHYGTFPFLIDQPACHPDSDPFLILLVFTDYASSAARKAIRLTWGRPNAFPGIPTRMLFLLGEGGNEMTHAAVLQENELNKDILMQAFRDSYRNLTLKMLMGLSWVASHCPRTPYVMKLDQDTFVNLRSLLCNVLQSGNASFKQFFMGHVIDGGPDRNNRSKWFMPESVYKGRRYPSFCSGSGYLMSGDVSAKLVQAAHGESLLYLEDVTVGFLLRKIGIKPIANPQFYHWRIPFSTSLYSHLNSNLIHWYLVVQPHGQPGALYHAREERKGSLMSR